MGALGVSLKENKGPGSKQYHNSVNASNYKEIALVLLDLSNLDLPIEKAIREFINLKKSTWEASIGA